MKTVKHLLAIFFMLIPLVLSAQSARQQAQELFQKAQYNDAASLCYGAAALETPENQKGLYALAKKCENCLSLMKQGNALYVKHNYGEAAKCYQKLLALNPSDSQAKSKLNSCNKNLAALADKENEWNGVVANGSAEAYADYISKNPNGAHVKEAKTILADYENWNRAKRQNTQKAYENYLNTTKVTIHVKEANDKIEEFRIADNKKALEQRDADAWRRAYVTNTKQSYQSYLDDRTNKMHRNEAKARIIKFDAKDHYYRKEYAKAVEKFQAVEIYDKMSAEDQNIFNICLEEMQYAAAKSSSDIQTCLDFLVRWPQSVHCYEISNRLAQLYADSGEFDLARLYAKSKTANKYVKERVKAAKRNNKSNPGPSSAKTGRTSYVKPEKEPVKKEKSSAKTARSSAGHSREVFYGFGYSYDTDLHNSRHGLSADFKFGSNEHLLNFTLSETYVFSNNCEKAIDADQKSWQANMSCQQLETSGMLRFNLNFRSVSAARWYLAPGATFNYNFMPSLNFTDQRPDLVWANYKIREDAFVNKFTYSAKLALGFNVTYFDMSIYGVYDIKPTFNEPEFGSLELPEGYSDYDFSSLQSAISKKFRLGVSVKLYF